jgi:hypothetical protein
MNMAGIKLPLSCLAGYSGRRLVWATYDTHPDLGCGEIRGYKKRGKQQIDQPECQHL